MYYSSDNYLGEYSNNPSLKTVTPSEDFGLDAYEPQFFYPLLQWKATPKEEDPEGTGYYSVALHIPVDEEFVGTYRTVLTITWSTYLLVNEHTYL